MTTLQELTLYIILIFAFICAPIIMDSLAAPKTNVKHDWDDQETLDLVDHIYDHRKEISDGTYGYDLVGEYLTKKRPHRPRSRDSVVSKLSKVRTFSRLE